MTDPALSVTDAAWRWQMDLYEARILVEIGRQQLEDEWHAVRAEGGRVARMLAASPSFAELCERRGEPEKAARQRAILAERGISQGVSA